MGDYADMIIDGTMCESCGEFIGPGDGFPRQCRGCCADQRRNQKPMVTPSGKIQCPHCNRKLRNEQGLHDHLRDKHNTATEYRLPK